ncbi:ImmA/IrrE family metallo-endopeptidase [Pseudactinotalea sp. HY158]|uniref:ImmA/IrrE family metallo-endopeptidase n=1 Tax=Pseudactinotalea sp. HY158 TaxID=2654547 RepID=UPI0018928069|nr:ImmA/IrrE family metallo-endopeptidase [Pseudactinotalea sp. HY158]
MTTAAQQSILSSLRQLIPARKCTFDEVLRVTEMQAGKLVTAIRERDPRMEGIQIHHLAELPRMRIAYEALPVSGMSHWNGREWVITICASDSPARQRFTALHEYAHIVSHGATERLFTGTKHLDAQTQAERVADYFAACALMPRRDLKRAWVSGLQSIEVLADHFGVSQAAITVRLDQTGIARERDPEPAVNRSRCARPVRTPRNRPQEFEIRTRRRCV